MQKQKERSKIFFSNCIIIFAKLYILSKQKTETRLRPLRPKHSREITSHTISLLLLKDYSKHKSKPVTKNDDTWSKSERWTLTNENIVTDFRIWKNNNKKTHQENEINFKVSYTGSHAEMDLLNVVIHRPSVCTSAS